VLRNVACSQDFSKCGPCEANCWRKAMISASSLAHDLSRRFNASSNQIRNAIFARSLPTALLVTPYEVFTGRRSCPAGSEATISPFTNGSESGRKRLRVAPHSLDRLVCRPHRVGQKREVDERGGVSVPYVWRIANFPGGISSTPSLRRVQVGLKFSLMRELFVLIAHLLTTVAKLAGPAVWSQWRQNR